MASTDKPVPVTDDPAPMSVARLRRLMTDVPTIPHFRGGRARVFVAMSAANLEAESRARQDDWSDPAYGHTDDGAGHDVNGGGGS